MAPPLGRDTDIGGDRNRTEQTRFLERSPSPCFRTHQLQVSHDEKRLSAYDPFPTPSLGEFHSFFSESIEERRLELLTPTALSLSLHFSSLNFFCFPFLCCLSPPAPSCAVDSS